MHPGGEHDICVNQPGEVVEEIFHRQLKVDPIEAKPYTDSHADKAFFQLTPFINAEEEAIILPAVPTARWAAGIRLRRRDSQNTKQNGIDQIIRHFGIKLEETMAFGDGGNDISMLRHAGIGVAMGNANDDVKAASNYTTTSVDEDGIANALKYFGIVGNPS